MKRVYDFLKSAETYYLATTEGDQPRVRPFGTINEFEGKLYIQTGKSKPVSEQIHKNPKAEICAFKDGTWLRVECMLKEDDRREARKAMLDAYYEVTESDRKPITMGGGTYARSMPNIVAFGCDTGEYNWHIHDDNEFVTLKSLQTQTEIYTKALINLLKI